MKNVLFVTWDGPQVFYTETLFAPIFAGLRDRGYEVSILQFSWGSDERRAQVAHACADWGIRYQAAPVNRRWGVLGPFASAMLGRSVVRRVAEQWGIDIMMPRSLMAGLVCLAAGRLPGVAEVFDADGLAADERVDVRGESRWSATYRLLRAIETRLIRRADIVLTRSAAATAVLAERARLSSDVGFHVVRNGRDEAIFTPLDEGARPGPAAEEDGWAPKLIYAGSLGEQYRAPEMLRIAGAVRDRYPGTSFHVMTGSIEWAERMVQEQLGRCPDWIQIERLPPQRMPGALAHGDFAFALRKHTFSSRAIAPVKVGEYLLCGVPVIGTADVGDVDGLDAAGVWMSYAGDPGAVVKWVEASRRRLPAMRQACREEGVRRFSLEAAIDSYDAALSHLPGSGAGPRDWTATASAV